MWIKRRRGWELPESAATPEAVYHDRRRLLQAMGLGAGLVAGAGTARPAAAQWIFGREREPPRQPDPTDNLYPVARNARYTVDRPLTPEREAITYNKFDEVGA